MTLKQLARALAYAKNTEVLTLAEGEIYIGAIGDALGNLHHVILLPGDNAPSDWDTQAAWAQSIGGELPTRVEQSLLFSQCKSLFKEEAYWSNDCSESGWAWFQYFYGGTQGHYRKGYELRARAVRRLPIQLFTHS